MAEARQFPWIPRLPPLAFLLALLLLWQWAVARHPGQLLPGPWAVGKALVELARSGLLVRYTVASLFRVTWGFGLAAATAIPLGMYLGRQSGAERALNPLIQILRPISPLAWIPIAILWFGVGDLASIFLIFLGSFFPLLINAVDAVRSVPAVYVQSGHNLGLSPTELFRRVLLPAALPRLVAGLRLTLGIAWLVVVAAEMIAVNSGLGFLIVDARNAGNRYDLVVAGIAVIGVIGLGLDQALRALERTPALAWSDGSR